MTARRSDHSGTPIGPIVDHDALRDREDVPYHENRDVVAPDVVDEVATLPDLAAVGITDEAGRLLFRRQTDTCSWKIPVETVAPDEDFATAIRAHVRGTIGFDLTLTDIAGVWDIQLRTDDGDRTASRAFVVFAGLPTGGSYDLAAVEPTAEAVEAADWFADLPSDADQIPGTEQFLDA